MEMKAWGCCASKLILEPVNEIEKEKENSREKQLATASTKQQAVSALSSIFN